ncbi:MAG: nitroreductase family protein [Rikenellaceae bacterium]|nr:nitroreductase family protein [Rikenellaceae bacterium]MCL2692011.1 nitroreductase family protein [Rikenellaceae bacterium]
MDFKELAFARRSVRRFAEREVPQGVVQSLLDVTFTAPSSRNLRTTRIAVSRDRGVLAAVAQMRSRGSAFVADAPLAFFIMGDDAQTDLWRENCAISATMLQFAAEDAGLGSCWVHVHGRPHDENAPDGMTAEQYLRANIPSLPPYPVLCVVAAGYSAETPAPHAMRDDSDKVFNI